MEILVITGTPGTGKTSVSRILAKKLGAFLVEVGELVLREKLYSRYDQERETYVADLARVRERIAEIIRGKEKVIIEGHYAPLVAPDEVDVVVVLRCDPDELRERLKEQGYSERKVAENVNAEILDVCLCEAVERYGGDRVLEVDTSGKTPEETARELEQLLAKGVRRIGVVDWLGKLDKEGRLGEFFRSL